MTERMRRARQDRPITDFDDCAASGLYACVRAVAVMSTTTKADALPHWPMGTRAKDQYHAGPSPRPDLPPCGPCHTGLGAGLVFLGGRHRDGGQPGHDDPEQAVHEHVQVFADGNAHRNAAEAGNGLLHDLW